VDDTNARLVYDSGNKTGGGSHQNGLTIRQTRSGSEVNMLDGSIARLELPAARWNSISDIRGITGTMFESQLPRFDHCDTLTVDGAFPAIRICYVSPGASNSDDRTVVDCRLHFDSRQMWIRSIQVPVCHRRQGVGRQLVAAAEATANALGMEEVRILPVTSSVEFCLKLNYAPAPRSARVFWKNLADGAGNPGQSPGRTLSSSTFRGINLTATTHRV
jgi:GNAT superfamily N-acetyltransferase